MMAISEQSEYGKNEKYKELTDSEKHRTYRISASSASNAKKPGSDIDGQETDNTESLVCDQCNNESSNAESDVNKCNGFQSSCSTFFAEDASLQQHQLIDITNRQDFSKSPESEQATSSQESSPTLDITTAQAPSCSAVCISKITAPAIQSQMAKIMGCKTSLLRKPSTHNSKAQTFTKKFQDKVVQSDLKVVSDVAIQTSDIDADAHAILVLSSRLEQAISDRHNGTKSSSPKPRETKLNWTAQAKVKSLVNLNHRPGGGDTKITTMKLNFSKKAKPKITFINTQNSTVDNMVSKLPESKTATKTCADNGAGENIKIYHRKLTFRENAKSKIGSLENINHKPGGGNKKIFYEIVLKKPESPNTHHSKTGC